MTDCIVPNNVHKDKDGYPRLKFNKKFWRMNRLMWTLVNGDIPFGSVVAHSCNNKSCININHMYLCSAAQNSTDAARDGLYRQGESHPKSKITKDMGEAMWDMYNTEGMSQQQIAEIYGVSQSTVSQHIRNR